jgi:hypothetical protein
VRTTLKIQALKTFCLSDLENLCTFSGSLDEYLIKSFCLYRFSRPHYLIVGRHFLLSPPGLLGSLIRFTLNTFASVSNSSRSAVFSLVTLSLSLELPRSASNSHVRLLSSNSHVRPRTPTFGFVLELSRSASNSHVRLCPRTLTFGLELSRSAVSSNSPVRPRNLTIGCVTSFCFAHFSFSNSPVRPRTPTFGCATFFRTFSLFNHLICESL